MLRLVPELRGMSHSPDLLLFLYGVTDNRLRWEALLLDASCEAGRVLLSRWILAGVLHSARIRSTRSPGFCQTASVTGKRLPLSPSSTRGRRAQVQAPSTSQWLGSVKWVTGSLWWEESRREPLGQASERQKLLGGVCLPIPASAHCRGRTCFVWQEKAEIIHKEYSLLCLILLFWLLSCCRRCRLCTCLSQESTASYGQRSRNCCQRRAPVLPCITGCKSGCQEHLKYILMIQLQLRVAERKENGLWW